MSLRDEKGLQCVSGLRGVVDELQQTKLKRRDSHLSKKKKNTWIWKQAAERGIVVTVRKNSACSYQKWVWLMGLLNPRNWILWKFARGRSMKILSLENLSLYGMLFIPLILLLTLTTCFLLSPIATLWTAAFTPTKEVSCHLHSHSITMSYVKGGNAVQNDRQL